MLVLRGFSWVLTQLDLVFRIMGTCSVGCFAFGQVHFRFLDLGDSLICLKKVDRKRMCAQETRPLSALESQPLQQVLSPTQAIVVWKYVVKLSKHEEFLDMDISEWVMLNLSDLKEVCNLRCYLAMCELLAPRPNLTIHYRNRTKPWIRSGF
ncbi:hypothetical protein V6N13_045869 [Hibiscus sabdariffa]